MRSVLVHASSAVVRAGLESLVEGQPGLSLAGSTRTLEDLRNLIASDPPDVVLGEGVEGTGRQLQATLRGGPPVVILSDDLDVASLDEGAGNGQAVLPRDAGIEQIAIAIEAVSAGLVVLDPSRAIALLAVSRPRDPAALEDVEALTPRELEVLAMMAEGAANKAIARRLDISEHTVKFHVGSILAKLRAESRTEAVTVGMRAGLIAV